MGGGISIYPRICAGLLAAPLLLIGAACSPVTPLPVQTVLPAASPTPERTSIMLNFPQPTETPPAPVLPTPTMELPPTDEVGSSDLPDYYGGLVITLDYVGQTILMKPGQGFLFSLGDSFDWQISVDPPEVLTINQRYIAQPGEQGVYIAREKGRATVKAVGSPRCLLNDPPCARPNVLFTLYVNVE